MRKLTFKSVLLLMLAAAALVFTSIVVEKPAYCQETTGGLQGTVKDPSGAVVPKAKVVLTSTAMVGSKELITDSSGYYRFANLPPGTYSLTITAQGFKTEKREGVTIGVGRLPTLDLALQIGAETATVEVSTEAPVIDTTSTTNLTNIDTQALQNLPTGTSFQSVIQFAPMARNEPLAGQATNGEGMGGSGGSLPGSSGNGLSFGYSIGGAADSESSYLVEGQDTENISGGYSKANVPMDFIQEVSMKTSGIAAEYGGALGGVVNVIMKKGTNDFHGSFYTTYESSGTDANPVTSFLRYDPTDSGDAATRTDPAAQLYQPSKDHFRTLQPGFTIGGPIVKDRLTFFAGFNPLVNSRAKTVDFGTNANNAGNQYFTQDRNTWYTTARLDYTVTPKIRVFGSWLYQYARETGDSLPIADPIASQSSYLNTSILSPLAFYSHGLGWSAPNATYNTGADISITQNLVSTTRYGYFFENYHDFGWPTSAPNLFWYTNGSGASGNDGKALPDGLQNYNGAPANAGTQTTPYLSSYTLFNANKHYQLNQDFAFFKGRWAGTHNFKFGYQLNHLVNVISQNGNVPFAYIYAGTGNAYHPFTTTGAASCQALTAAWGSCTGQYGYLKVQDFATVLTTPAADWNHALYVQDSWQVGKGLTLDVGIRFERENLPAPNGSKVKSIDFPWSDKVAPRLGAAWDPTRTGRMKVFGSYGVVNDVMKLLLAQTSWGAQAYEWCSYPLGPDGTAAGFNTSDIDLVFKGGRACPSAAANVGANFNSGQVPAGLTDAKSGTSLIENVNLRPWEPVAPGVKPYRQHEYVAGFDYEIKRGWAFEARYDRRRLDHVIEDSSLWDPDWGETYTIVNPGEGVNSTVNGYANFLTSLGQSYGVPGWAFNADPNNPFGTCGSCPRMPKAVRNYDGVEFRLMMQEPVRGFSGMISYTYSSLWGNYTGLTTTDQSDGGNTGRNSPDTTRAFDEPFYYYGANGKSTNGALPTDRPNVFKGYAYYSIPWMHRHVTNIGLFQQFLQGSPVGSYINLGAASPPLPFEATYVYGRDKWVNLSTDSSGNITIGNPTSRRTPWFTQTDMNASHQIKVGERQALQFEATALNIWNQRADVAYFESMDTLNFATPLIPGGVPIYSGAATYQALMSGYDPQALINTNGVIKNSQYGQPFRFQLGRQLRLAVHYTF